MTIIPFLFVLFAASYAQAVPVVEPPCSGTSVTVDSGSKQTDYSISMSAESTSEGRECTFDENDLRKMLKGSGQAWNNTCKRSRSNVLVIETAADCDESSNVWKAQYLTFKLKSANRVQVHIDDQLVFAGAVENQFTYENTIQKAGQSIRVTAHPRLRSSVIEFSEVQVNFCCEEEEEVSGGEKTQVETAKEVDNEDDMAADIIRKLREKKRREESSKPGCAEGNCRPSICGVCGVARRPPQPCDCKGAEETQVETDKEAEEEIDQDKGGEENEIETGEEAAVEDAQGDAETQVEADKEADEKGAEDKDINAEIGKDKIMDKEEAAEIIRKLREKKLREKSDAETQVEADKEADEKGAEDKDINVEIGKDKIMDKEEAEIIRKLREKKCREKKTQVEADKEADDKGAEDKDINVEIGKDKIMDKEEAEIIRKLREKKRREKMLAEIQLQ